MKDHLYVRRAYYIKIPLCLNFVLLTLGYSVLIGLSVLMLFVFSPNSSLYFKKETCLVENKEWIIEKSQSVEGLFDRYYEVNVTYVDSDVNYLGVFYFCFEEGGDELTEKQGKCLKNVYSTYHLNSSSIPCSHKYGTDRHTVESGKREEMFLSKRLRIMFLIEIIGGSAVNLILFLLFPLLALSYILFLEFYMNKMFTQIKNKQLPRTLSREPTDDDWDQMPFLPERANMNHWGKMTLSRSTIVTPKLDNESQIVSQYYLDYDSHHRCPRIKEYSGLWKCLAATTDSEHEKILAFAKPTFRALAKWKMLRSVLIPSMILLLLQFFVVIVGLILAYFFPFLRLCYGIILASEVVIGPLTVVVIYISLKQHFSAFSIITDRRVIHLNLSLFSDMIFYLYYKDFNGIDKLPNDFEFQLTEDFQQLIQESFNASAVSTVRFLPLILNESQREEIFRTIQSQISNPNENETVNVEEAISTNENEE